MAKINKDEFIAGLKEMTMLEVMELVDAMKEEFGVDPSAVAVAAAPRAISEWSCWTIYSYSNINCCWT